MVEPDFCNVPWGLSQLICPEMVPSPGAEGCSRVSDGERWSAVLFALKARRSPVDMAPMDVLT